MLRAVPRVLSTAARPQAARAFSAAAEESIIQKVGLDDWKRQLPLGIILGIPLIQNEMLMLSAETQLVGCFAMFCGTVYTLGADSVAEMLDNQGKAIIAQHNAAEDVAIQCLKEEVKEHEANIAVLSEMHVIEAAVMEADAALKLAHKFQNEHSVRDNLVKRLDQLVVKEESAAAAITAKLVADATAAVTAKAMADAKLKESLLKESIAMIGGAKPGVDLVTAEFKAFFKAEGVKAKAAPAPSAAQLKAIQAERDEEKAVNQARVNADNAAIQAAAAKKVEAAQAKLAEMDN